MLKSEPMLSRSRSSGNFPPGSIGEAQSRTIKLARVLCIIFMMTNHAWPGSERILAADVSLPLHTFYVVVVDSLGSASVPLLSIVSGLLIFISLEKSKFDYVILGKIQTLIIPMALWSVPIVIIMFIEPLFKNTPIPDFNFLDWMNLFFSLTDSPANSPLHFFRDIFIMSLYTSIVFWIWKKNRVAATCLAICVIALEQIPGGLLIFRNQIAAMYVFGFLLAAWGLGRWQPSWKISLGCLFFYVSYQTFGPSNPVDAGIFMQRFWEIAPRAAMAMVMWRISASLVDFTKFSSQVERLEPHIFVVFCSHMIVIKFVSLAALIFGWSETSYLYPLLLIGQIVLFVVVGVIASHILKPFPLLRGKKVNLGNPAVAGQNSAQ